MSSNGCSGSSSSQQQTSTNVQQATPFNIGIFGVLFVFCIIIALTSSLYYNWPAIERILVDDKVFQNLCTKDEIYNAIDGMFVCDEQRKQIGNLALIIFYTEFIAFAIGGLLTDIIGVYIVLVLGFMFGFAAFLILYFYHFSNGMIKIAFAHWGMFGGFVFITSIQFPKMFPEATSLADGMIIMFDNISGLMPIIIYKLMKNFNLKYYEAFGTYILWGIIPSFLLVITFIPYKIMPKNQSSNNDVFKCMDTKLKDHKLWTNYIVFSIPVTCSIFYKKTFSTYFLKNQTLVKIFPIIMLFVFVPTIFIAALNQFMGVHITSCILYIFYIISFVCFLYPTKQYGLLSIILFVISTSAAEQQTMTYISENHPYNESTLLGISYAVDFIVGSILQRIFDRIFDRSPMSILYLIIPLFIICILYSLYCSKEYFKNSQQSGQSHTKSPSFRGLFLILWVIPFLLLCLVLSFNKFSIKKTDISKISIFKSNINNYNDVKNTLVSIIFYSFTFYYICDSFIVISSIIKYIYIQHFRNQKFHVLFCFLCFFVIPQGFVFYFYSQSKSKQINVIVLTGFLFILKCVLFIFTISKLNERVVLLFCTFLIIYGFVFFLFIYMLAYYNFQITYVDRCYKTSLLHRGSMISVFILFMLFHNILKKYETGFLIIWLFNVCFFIYFAIVLYLYLPYEMDIQFNFNSSNLPVPNFPEFNIFKNFRSNYCDFYYIIGAVSLSILSFGVLINIGINKLIIWLLIISSLYDITVVFLRTFFENIVKSNQSNKYLSYSLTGVSMSLFLILLLFKMFVNDNNYKLSNIIVFIEYINIVIIILNSNISWLGVQSELQDCCCTKNSGRCGCSGTCCCVNSKNKNECKCLNKDKCCCCCCKPKDTVCNCNPQCFQQCRTGENCKNCICKCSKNIKAEVEGGSIIFCFYECNFEKVDEILSWYYLGTIIGWLKFIIYLNVSRGKVLYNVLL